MACRKPVILVKGVSPVRATGEVQRPVPGADESIPFHSLARDAQAEDLDFDQRTSLPAQQDGATPPAPRARMAWYRRAAILSTAARPALARQFLRSCRQYASQSFSVLEAARDLGVGRSTLERLSLAWFGVPPGLVIDLVRILSVSDDLTCTEEPLKIIAQRHAFSSVSNMGRMFVRYVGVAPGIFRGRGRARQARDSGQSLTETDY